MNGCNILLQNIYNNACTNIQAVLTESSGLTRFFSLSAEELLLEFDGCFIDDDSSNASIRADIASINFFISSCLFNIVVSISVQEPCPTSGVSESDQSSNG